jgi:hypothetical protein
MRARRLGGHQNCQIMALFHTADGVCTVAHLFDVTLGR